MTEEDTFNMLRRIEYTSMRSILQSKFKPSVFETYTEYLGADPGGRAGAERDKALHDNGWNHMDFMKARKERIYKLKVSG
jgi:hypothetical protein